MLDAIARQSGVDDHDLIEKLVEHPCTEPETLRFLYQRGIRYFHYANVWGSTPNWTADLLVTLMIGYYSYHQDENPEVVADQHHFNRIVKTEKPEAVLAWAATCKLYYHCGEANCNRHTPSEAIAQFAAHADPDAWSYTFGYIARNPAAPVNVLRTLMHSQSYYRVKNPLLPDSIMREFCAPQSGVQYQEIARRFLRARSSRGIHVDDQGLVRRSFCNPASRE